MCIIYMHTYVDTHTLIYTVTEYYIKIHMHSHMHRHIVSRYYTWMHMYSHIHKVYQEGESHMIYLRFLNTTTFLYFVILVTVHSNTPVL